MGLCTPLLKGLNTSLFSPSLRPVFTTRQCWGTILKWLRCWLWLHHCLDHCPTLYTIVMFNAIVYTWRFCLHCTPFCFTLYTILFTPYTILFTPDTILFTPYTISFTPYTILFTPYDTPFCLHITPLITHYTIILFILDSYKRTGCSHKDGMLTWSLTHCGTTTRLNTMKRFCICSLWSYLDVLTFSPLTGGCSLNSSYTRTTTVPCKLLQIISYYSCCFFFLTRVKWSTPQMRKRRPRLSRLQGKKYLPATMWSEVAT